MNQYCDLTGHQKRVMHVAAVVILFMSEDDEQVLHHATMSV